MELLSYATAVAKIIGIIASLGGVAVAFLVAAWLLPRFREWFLIGAAVAIAAGGIYSFGVHHARDAAEANLARLQARFTAMQHRVNGATARHADDLQRMLQQNDEALSKVVDDYALKLKAHKDRICTLDDADLERLRQLER
jgi:hypothetical protein